MEGNDAASRRVRTAKYAIPLELKGGMKSCRQCSASKVRVWNYRGCVKAR